MQGVPEQVRDLGGVGEKGTLDAGMETRVRVDAVPAIEISAPRHTLQHAACGKPHVRTLLSR